MRKFYKIVVHGTGQDQVLRIPCVNVGDPDRAEAPIAANGPVAAFAARRDRSGRPGGVTTIRSTPTT